MAEGGIKLAFMGAIGLLCIDIALTGKLGSLLGAIIDPANMQDTGNSGLANEQKKSGGGPDASSGVLSVKQIKALASQIGFSGNSLNIAVAICLAESGGKVNAVSPPNTNGTIDRGLWQINSVHTQYDPAKLLTAIYNAQAAYAISNGGNNWIPWSTYTEGRYLQYLSQAKAA